MTAREVWEGLLTELSKVHAPSMLLLDFNYFFNKAINQYINKRYNIYDVNQQTTDDLRVLKSTAFLPVTKVTTKSPLKEYADWGAGSAKLFGATYEVTLPSDYLHLLNCVCIYKLNKDWKCYDKGNDIMMPAKRLTADSWSMIVNDYYNRPLPTRPYYYIHNVNINNTIPTNPLTENNSNGTDLSSKYIGTPTETHYYLTLTVNNVPTKTLVFISNNKVYLDSSLSTEIKDAKVTDITTEIVQVTPAHSNFPRTILLGSPDGRVVSTVDRDTATRYGNASNVRMEIRYGSDDSVFALEQVLVDYIKSPLTIRLTLEQVNLTEDTSQIMEFPDYVCQEIINELVLLVMENTADPRTQSHISVTQSIANPAQQLTPQPQALQ